MGGHQVIAAGSGIMLAVLTLGSCWACYALGYKKGERDVLKAFADYVEAQRNEKLFK